MTTPRREHRWVAHLIPTEITSIDELLTTGGLDVWERHAGALVVAADQGVLAELERRGLARVRRLATPADYIHHAGRSRNHDPEGTPE